METILLLIKWLFYQLQKDRSYAEVSGVTKNKATGELKDYESTAAKKAEKPAEKEMPEDKTKEQMVFAEATSVLPLIASDAYHREHWKKREKRKLK